MPYHIRFGDMSLLIYREFNERGQDAMPFDVFASLLLDAIF